jgi:hypothetical protein
MNISFCTTCANRFYQLEQTFESNLNIIIEHPNTQWVILNYNSKDELHEFMLKQLPFLPSRIIYARSTSNKPWHISVAKNMAHRLGSGEVLVNLDCDNFIGNAVEIISSKLTRSVQMLHLWSGTYRDGSWGRIALAKDVFYALGGYDESFYPMGYDDRDLLERAIAYGISVVHFPCVSKPAIQNSKEDSIKYCTIRGLNLKSYVRLNKKKSQFNIAAKYLVANKDSKREKAHIEIFKGEK